MPAPGFRTVPRWTHYVGTCDRQPVLPSPFGLGSGSIWCRINPYKGHTHNETTHLQIYHSTTTVLRTLQSTYPFPKASVGNVQSIITFRTASRPRVSPASHNGTNQRSRARRAGVPSNQMQKVVSPSPFQRIVSILRYWKTYPVQSPT